MLSKLIADLRARSDAIGEMPFGLVRINESMREMTDAVVSTTNTLDHVQRLVLRVDRLIGDLEEPLRSLAPGLTRLAKVLDDPAVDLLPDTVHRLSQDALPLVKGMRETQARMAMIAAGRSGMSPRGIRATTDDRSRRTSRPPMRRSRYGVPPRTAPAPGVRYRRPPALRAP